MLGVVWRCICCSCCIFRILRRRESCHRSKSLLLLLLAVLQLASRIELRPGQARLRRADRVCDDDGADGDCASWCYDVVLDCVVMS